MATEILDREELINQIWANKGKVGLVAQKMGVTSPTIYNYANRYASVKKAIDDARANADELLVDTAELKLQAAVMNGEPWSIKYTLGTKGKDRGYVERSEINHKVEDVSKLSDDELRAIVEAKGSSGA